MGIYLNRGNNSFRKCLNGEIYVDKSMLISKTNKAVATNDSFWCETRPRRFRKTITINMLNAYYSKGCDSRELFSNLKIAEDPSFDKHLNKHNVIFIDIAGEMTNSINSENFISKLSKKIIQELKDEFPSCFQENDDILAQTLAKNL